MERTSERAIIKIFILASAIALLGHSQFAFAADKLRVGKSVATSFSYVPLDVGVSQGIFQKEGLDIEEINFTGAAPMETAMIANSLDIGLGASAMIAHLVKGSPETAVAVSVTTMANLGLMVAYDSPLKTLDDLKGKNIGITTVGSLSDLLVRMLNSAKGWGNQGAKAIAIGSSISGMSAALKVHAVDAIVGDVGLVFEFEDSKEARLLAPVSSYAGNFPREIVFASNKLLKDNPDAVRRFVKAWFESIAFMKTHKTETVATGSKVEELKVPYEERMYDLAVSMFSDTGKFDPAGLKALSRSFLDMELLPNEADLTPFYSEAYLPSGK
jgi:NitT/TauT family transport system substrate-binding protein